MILRDKLEKQGSFLFKYRGVLPVLFLLAGWGLFVYKEYNSYQTQPVFDHPLYLYFCLFICLLGLFIRVYTIGYTPKRTSGRNIKGQIADQLNTTGIYSIVRHPLYLGNFFMWLGIAMLVEDIVFIIAFILLYALYYERIMLTEEKFLKEKFKDSYLQWSKKTPAFIPDFRKWKKPGSNFRIKKVLLREKNGLLAIFLLIYLFVETERYIQSNTYSFELNFWFYAVAFSLFYYLVIKTLQKTVPGF